MSVGWVKGLLLALSLSVGAGSTGPLLAASSAQSTCKEACYQSKSMAYQQCRSIPPSQRAERVRCFKEADLALQRCLRSCR